MNPKKISLKKFVDRRGYLLELLPKEFKKKFIYFIITKSKKNVLRGLHYDKNIQEEKLVFLLEGKILDVCVNLKKKDKSNIKYYNTLKRGDCLYIPKGFAHGYKCIGENNVLIYFLSKFYNVNNNKGINWKDETLKINWKIKKPIISSKDNNLPNFK